MTEKNPGCNVARRKLLKNICSAGVAIGLASCKGIDAEFFKKNYRLMSEKEKADSISRLERAFFERYGKSVSIATTKAPEKVLFGYAFNLTRCRGSMECVSACIRENNLDRKSRMQYIRIQEKQKGSLNPQTGRANYYHQVPAAGHFYMTSQCFQCENPSCVKACPVKATWKTKDGIVTVDYDWCIGCRYCQAACPYMGRRFNWGEPKVPVNEINTKQHYLGNRMRKKGVMEKCTWCIQRSRKGKNPACVEACPTGARIFGNLLDPKSEIRYVLENKKVFRLKEELHNDPKFWYFMD